MKKLTYILPAALLMFTSCAQQEMSAFFPEAEQETQAFQSPESVFVPSDSPAFPEMDMPESGGLIASESARTVEDDPRNEPEPVYRGEQRKGPASTLSLEPQIGAPTTPTPGPKRPNQKGVAPTN